MRHVWRSGWAACVDGATPRARFSGAKVGEREGFVSNEETGVRGVSRLVRGAGTYLVLADVGFIEKRLERARGERAHRSLFRVAEERGARGVEEKGVRGACFRRSTKTRSDVCSRFPKTRRRAEARASVAAAFGAIARRRSRRERRTLLNSVSACCSTSKSPKFRGEKACGMCRPSRGGKRRVAVRRASGEGCACGRVRVETAYRGRTARVGCSKKTQTYLRDVVRGRYVFRRARSPARGELIHAQLLFLPGAVAASGVALARDERLGRRRLRELPGRIRERHDRAHGLEVEVLRHRAHSRGAARRVRGPREEG